MFYVVVGGKEIRLFDVNNIELFLENPILFLSITKITYIQIQYIYIPILQATAYSWVTHLYWLMVTVHILIFYEVLYYTIIFLCAI
jgi:hypothetical protein